MITETEYLQQNFGNFTSLVFSWFSQTSCIRMAFIMPNCVTVDEAAQALQVFSSQILEKKRYQALTRYMAGAMED